MELLNLRIPTTRITEDGSTWTYGIEVSGGPNLHWTCYRRFSEFLSLAERLDRTWGLRGYPSPPPKSLGRPQSASLIEERRSLLENWLQTCCRRADLRTCPAMVDFLQWETNTGTSPVPLAPVLEDSRNEGRFFLSRAKYIPRLSLLFAAFEEAAAASRLGRVWSIVERDAMGAIAIYKLTTSEGRSLEEDLRTLPHSSSIGAEGPSSRSLLRDLLRQDGPCRVKDIYFHSASSRVFLGLDTGHVEIHQASPQLITEGAAYAALCRETSLALHSESVLHLSGTDDGPGRVLSVGLDKTIRVLNCLTLETLCGGKLDQRLEHGVHLTVGELEESFDEQSFMASRIFLGTTAGRVLVLASRQNPPQFIKEIAGVRGMEPITALKSVGSNLLVAQKRLLHVFKVGKGDDKAVQLSQTLEATFSSGRTIRSIAISVSTPLLFLGHEGCISVWDCVHGNCCSAFRAHSGSVLGLHCIEDSEAVGIRLVSAGRDGEIRVWRVPDTQAICSPSQLGRVGSVPALPENSPTSSTLPSVMPGPMNCQVSDDDDELPPKEFTQLHSQPRLQ